MEAVDVDILVLNHNGRALLAECLPTVLTAAARSRHDCRVTVVDNASRDDSVEFTTREFSSVAVVRMPNLGLVSFNAASAACTSRVVLLLNNDIALDESAIDPLVEPFLACDHGDEPVFMTTPRCRLFDGITHEGFKTAVRWRRGLVQATAHFPGAEQAADLPSETASSGAVIAVDRQVFLDLGGFDPLYLPGRIEDLDLCFRAFTAGYRALYVPDSLARHKGAATFGPTFGNSENLRLAHRNTLLFQWKNLRLLRHRLCHACWLPVRLTYDAASSLGRKPADRFAFWRAWREARTIWKRQTANGSCAETTSDVAPRREAEFFSRFTPGRLAAPQVVDESNIQNWHAGEQRRARALSIGPILPTSPRRVRGLGIEPHTN
ncbi:MAG: glycosyltransferase [Pirellulales bacterium]